MGSYYDLNIKKPRDCEAFAKVAYPIRLKSSLS